MPPNRRYYQRLTRSRAGVGTYTSLWLGPDHLLLVTSSGYFESYQRFYFRDIQCLVAADSIRSVVLNTIFGVILLFCAIPTLILTLTGSGISPWVLLPVLPSLFILVYNLCLGRTCTVTLMTGVQSLRLPPLSRFRRTRKVFARLVPLIEAAQAALVPPPLAPQPTPAALPPAGTEPPEPIMASSPADPSDRSDPTDQSDQTTPGNQPSAAPSAQ